MSGTMYTVAEMHEAEQNARLRQIGRSAEVMQQMKNKIKELEEENAVLKHKLEVAEFGEESATSALRDEHEHVLALEEAARPEL